MRKFFGNDVIEFYTTSDLFDIIPKPRASQKFLPDWFKGLSTHYEAPNDARDAFGNKQMTAKKCMPLLDVMSLGFIIPLAGDTHVRTNQDCSRIEITSPPKFTTADFHDVRQVGEQSAPGFPANPIKWLNPWTIRTAPGWSTLFISPVNHFNPNFTCLGGFVDTDKYPKAVHFPSIWHTPNFDGAIKAGTPLVQVIPIKRSTIQKKAKIKSGSKEDYKESDRINGVMHTRTGYYTDELRVKK